MRIEITVPGLPIGKARPRVTQHGTYTPKRTRDYEKLVRTCWKEQSGKKLPDGVPIKMSVMCFFPIPKSYPKKKQKLLPGRPHIIKPDLDNCIKSASDGCQGYAFSEDACIYSIEAVKLYSRVPRMKIVVEDTVQIEALSIGG